MHVQRVGFLSRHPSFCDQSPLLPLFLFCRKHDYHGLRNKWKGQSIKYKKLFFPLNVGNWHWVLAVADMEGKKLQMFDPSHDSHLSRSAFMKDIFRCLKDNLLEQGKEEMNAEEWRLIDGNESSYPTQDNCK